MHGASRHVPLRVGINDTTTLHSPSWFLSSSATWLLAHPLSPRRPNRRTTRSTHEPSPAREPKQSQRVLERGPTVRLRVDGQWYQTLACRSPCIVSTKLSRRLGAWARQRCWDGFAARLASECARAPPLCCAHGPQRLPPPPIPGRLGFRCSRSQTQRSRHQRRLAARILRRFESFDHRWGIYLSTPTTAVARVASQ